MLGWQLQSINKRDGHCGPLAHHSKDMIMHPSTNAATAPAPPPERDSPTPASESHAEQALDEALKESFPASDPIAIATAKPSGSARA